MNDLLDNLPLLRPLRGGHDLERLVKAAAADGHLVWGPSHVIEKSGEIVGYIGLNSVPYFQGWFHTKQIGARESVMLFNQVENLARGHREWEQLMLLLPNTSPFCPVIERFGYRHLANAGLHLKTL